MVKSKVINYSNSVKFRGNRLIQPTLKKHEPFIMKNCDVLCTPVVFVNFNQS